MFSVIHFLPLIFISILSYCVLNLKVWCRYLFAQKTGHHRTHLKPLFHKLTRKAYPVNLHRSGSFDRKNENISILLKGNDHAKILLLCSKGKKNETVFFLLQFKSKQHVG